MTENIGKNTVYKEHGGLFGKRKGEFCLVTPLIFFTLHDFNIISLGATLIIAPLVALYMYAGITLLFCSLLLGHHVTQITFPAESLSWLIHKLVYLMSHLSLHIHSTDIKYILLFSITMLFLISPLNKVTIKKTVLFVYICTASMMILKDHKNIEQIELHTESSPYFSLTSNKGKITLRGTLRPEDEESVIAYLQRANTENLYIVIPNTKYPGSYQKIIKNFPVTECFIAETGKKPGRNFRKTERALLKYGVKISYFKREKRNERNKKLDHIVGNSYSKTKVSNSFSLYSKGVLMND